MDTVSGALRSGDALLQELTAAQPPAPHAETMGRLQKVSYSHKAMIDLIIENPDWTQNRIAAHFGYTPAWVSNVLASEAFQAAMASRRDEIVDPTLRATVRERFEALVRLSLDVLMRKLEQPVVSDQVAIRAAELGAKALGIGGHAPPQAQKETSEERLVRLAQRALALRKGEVINGEARILEVGEDGSVSEASSGLRGVQGPGLGEHDAGQGAGSAAADGR